MFYKSKKPATATFVAITGLILILLKRGNGYILAFVFALNPFEYFVKAAKGMELVLNAVTIPKKVDAQKILLDAPKSKN